MHDELKVENFLFSETHFAMPDWDRIGEWVELYVEKEDQFKAWTELALQWLHLINEQFGDRYQILETKHFLLFGFPGEVRLSSLGSHAEDCRRGLQQNLPGLAKFTTPGKTPILIFAGNDAYYAHVADYHGDGEYGGSSGMHIRNSYSHVAMLQILGNDLFQTSAHELTHAALAHLTLPLWIEEGLAQLFEHDLGNKQFYLNPKDVGEQKAFWRAEGLEKFWSGDGFSSPGDMQKHSYQLAEILLRLLLTDYQPRWFGFDQSPLRKLMNFLKYANRDDAGESAAQMQLGLSLEDIAAKSLGRQS
ncbi:hypothetical protein [Anatilimnocola floriformis]|uniref:hypothetical protein n=1 Tax=Anatilimnocola floriformis TaxID=2948575 RepID=UPI0020C57F33|nr:hypothetical protein [Anatilimnocola floriformis]